MQITHKTQICYASTILKIYMKYLNTDIERYSGVCVPVMTVSIPEALPHIEVTDDVWRASL